MAQDDAKSTAPAKRTSPGEFIDQVRQEARKVTWPSAKETQVSTIMVLIMIVIMSFFFLGVDTILRFVIGQLLTLAG